MYSPNLCIENVPFNIKMKLATAQTKFQKKKIKAQKKMLLRYPGFLKCMIVLDLVTICIAHARQYQCGMLTDCLNLNSFTVPC